MFAALVVVILSCGSDEPTIDAAPQPRPAGYTAPSILRPVQKGRYERWLKGLPYSQEYYAKYGYNFRHEHNIPWAVRSGHSLPIDTAASTRRFDDLQNQPERITPPPHSAPMPPAPRQSKANRPGATVSK